MRKIKVAFFVDVMEEHFDGVSNTVHQIIKRIPKDEIEPIFITPHPPKNDIGFPVHRCPYLNLDMNKGYRLALPRKMKRLPEILSNFDPDIVHWTSPSFLGKYAIKYAKKHGKPVTTIYHTHFPTYTDYYFGWIPGSKRIANWILNKGYFGFYHDSDAIFAPTKTMCDYLKSVGVDEEKIKIWGRGVDMTRFNYRFHDDHFWDGKISAGDRKILFVSRLVKEKETDTLIRLYELIEAKKQNLKLIITGDGPDRERMEKKMPNAIFMGMKKDEELARVYASCDLFIFPSVTETFGNVVLEALASGLPVIAANAGGPTDIVENGKRGFLIEPRNEQAFYDKIVQVLGDKELYKELQQNAIAYATKQSWRSLCGELFDTYQRLGSKD